MNRKSSVDTAYFDHREELATVVTTVQSHRATRRRRWIYRITGRCRTFVPDETGDFCLVCGLGLAHSDGWLEYQIARVVWRWKRWRGIDPIGRD